MPMGSTVSVLSESIRKVLRDLGEDDRRLFLRYKTSLIEDQIGDSPLLDQLCWVRLVRTRLSDNYAMALSTYREGLAGRVNMPGGWRKSRTIKSRGEFESPMPWLHPYKLAGEALQPLEEELHRSVTSGQTAERDISRLLQVLEEHDIRFPISPSQLSPKFPPRPLRTYM